MTSLFALSKKIADSNWFQIFIIAVILAAGIVVGIETYGDQVKDIAWFLHAADATILAIFTFEVVVKILAMGTKPLSYFKDGWNIFDFLIVAFCYVAILMPTVDASFIAVLRLARILRVFKLVTAIPKLQILVGALIKSIPSMGYVAILLALLFYIYAAMGVFVFGENDPVHFGNLQRAMLTLFRIVTLEGWTEIMYINMYGCDHVLWGYGADGGCVNPKGNLYLSVVYFVSFVLIGTMVILNLFIGVIMNSMDEAKNEAEAQYLAVKSEGKEQDNKKDLDIILSRIDSLKKDIAALESKLK